MKRWITSDVVALLSALPGISSVEVHPQGGDIDTSNLVVNITNGQDELLYVCGFCNGSDIIYPDDTDIDMIEVTDGQQSGTGLSSQIEEVCLAYARVVGTLRRAGFSVVDSLDDYC